MSFNELLQAARRSGRRPAFSAGVVLVLTLAIGANSAMFALVNAILLRPLPLTDPDRLITFSIVRPGTDRQPLSLLDLADFKASNRTLDGIVSMFGLSANLTGQGDTEHVGAYRPGHPDHRFRRQALRGQHAEGVCDPAGRAGRGATCE